MSRFARVVHVYYFEEPVLDNEWSGLHVARPSDDNIIVLTPHLRKGLTQDESNNVVNRLLHQFLVSSGIEEYIAWYYTPMALLYTQGISPTVTVYDCMDELSHFRFAPLNLPSLEKSLLEMADVVFTGGHSLYKAKCDKHSHVFAFPSSIDKEHFSKARVQTADPVDQRDIPKPRLGFYGVLDERFDFQLVEQMASMRPEWHIVLIGPIVKVDVASVPRATNIHYLGMKDYAMLPMYLANWDIAIMPFAINDSTRYISPTKTPEFLAAGKPVVSTAITDVVNDYGKQHLVSICDTAEEFVQECEQILKSGSSKEWMTIVDSHLADNSWDITWAKMKAIITGALEEKKVPLLKVVGPSI